MLLKLAISSFFYLRDLAEAIGRGADFVVQIICGFRILKEEGNLREAAGRVA